MSSFAVILSQVATYVALGVYYLWTACSVVAIALGLWALVDCLVRSPQVFTAADKRTKGFWLLVNVAGLAVVGFMGWASMLGLLGVVANAVYLADVRPALSYYTPVKVRARIRRPKGRPGTSGTDWRR